MAHIVSNKILVRLIVETKEKIWNRTYLASSVPNEKYYEFYYQILCGFRDAIVSVKFLQLPNGFNADVLKPLETAPSVFPHSDLETSIDEFQKRNEYNKFIDGLINMESGRINLNFVVEKTNLSKSTQERLEGLRDWVNEVLESMDENMYSDDNGQTLESIGWIVTPTHLETRAICGDKLLLGEIGKEWAGLLGTDHFPDLVVREKLHASGWKYNYEKSNQLYKQILEWYMESKEIQIIPGVSSWVRNIDKDIVNMISPFQTILRKTEEYPMLETNQKQEKQVDPEFDNIPTDKRKMRKIPLPVRIIGKQLRDEYRWDTKIEPTKVLLNLEEVIIAVESKLLQANIWPRAIEPVTYEMFQAFIQVICNTRRIKFTGNVFIEEKISSWVSKGLGLRPDTGYILEEWEPIWKAVIRERTSLQRIYFFLKTIQLQPQPDHKKIEKLEKEEIVGGWIEIFKSLYLIEEPNSYVPSQDLQEQCRLFCLQFVPITPWCRYFVPENIGPWFTKRGFITKRQYNGRRTHGLRYKRADEQLFEVPRFTIHATFSTSTIQTLTTTDGTTKKNEIQTTMEINLGCL